MNCCRPALNHAAPESVLEALMEVADLPEFVFDPARFDSLLEIDPSVAAEKSSFFSASNAVSAASMPLLMAR